MLPHIITAALSDPGGKTPQRYIPLEAAPLIEVLTNGEVTCEELRLHIRPGLKLGRMFDPSWVWHPKGRPVILFDVDAAIERLKPRS